MRLVRVQVAFGVRADRIQCRAGYGVTVDEEPLVRAEHLFVLVERAVEKSRENHFDQSGVRRNANRKFSSRVR